MFYVTKTNIKAVAIVQKRYDYITPNDYEIADRNGITQTALEQRVYNYGWDIDRAITQPMRVRKSFQSVWDEWGEIATKNGISREMFYSRIKSSGWSEEKAANTKRTRCGRKSRYTKEEKELAKRNGLERNSMAIVTQRITMLGWTKEKALNTPKLTEEERATRVAEGTRKYHRERGVNREFNNKNRAMGN